jgi:NADH dehydrogenase FAD-containing subunit
MIPVIAVLVVALLVVVLLLHLTRERPPAPRKQPVRVAIVGGGFAGVYAARELER